MTATCIWTCSRPATSDTDGDGGPDACDPWTADTVQLIASTGIRYGELTFLTVDDVDEDTLLIRCKELPFQMPEMVRRPVKDTSRSLWWPKDATDRVIPLTNMARDVLRRRVEAARRAGIPWLFANQAGNPRAHNKPLRLLKKAVVAASVMMSADGTSRLGWHTMRRHFVSIASTCMSLPSVLESAGHVHGRVGFGKLFVGRLPSAHFVPREQSRHDRRWIPADSRCDNRTRRRLPTPWSLWSYTSREAHRDALSLGSI